MPKPLGSDTLLARAAAHETAAKALRGAAGQRSRPRLEKAACRELATALDRAAAKLRVRAGLAKAAADYP